MLKIEMDDVIGVLQSCKVQIGVIVGVLALLVIALIACRKMKKSQKFLIRSQSVIAAVLAILVTANTVCFGPMSTLISLATGNGTVSEKTAEEAKEVAQQVAEEGFVLLKNDDSFLPLQNISKLNLFGWAASNPVYGGSGSGGINSCMRLSACRKASRMLALKLTKSCWISTALILLIVRKCLFRSRAGLCRSLLLVLTLRK